MSEPLRLICLGAAPGSGRRYAEVNHGNPSYLAFPADDPDTPARLAGPEAVALLRELEWCGRVHLCFDESRVACPWCCNYKPGALSKRDFAEFGDALHDDIGHAEGCRLAAILALGGEADHG